jgi:hypothetical protein
MVDRSRRVVDRSTDIYTSYLLDPSLLISLQQCTARNFCFFPCCIAANCWCLLVWSNTATTEWDNKLLLYTTLVLSWWAQCKQVGGYELVINKKEFDLAVARVIVKHA